ncbi:MAG TPA: AmmeMemoRadiSam system protein B [Candidatus Hydrogenedentes bacterium]|jgi:AmmeMemoRadiSam system protein B|nr:AmmeMemoRadiSam system protein B [FCB group bacterium]HNZ18037.1 AmmeMemoRadiSam system protein B [Candidatus Hydrogenedentota bacterium]HOH33050.1 AmmeMemoRadiSam system protein B [Candidatus Hydrogenedentota bacterium]HPA03676.1 AmmeMemoRadiSam system protein B [Candidatus Hydrogenedentota bacterium]HPV36491.1 AmmeMemoRadiSam system protein B [Candidatus Hydrogenedentota bacterium]
MALPALRNIDAFSVEHEGETMILVRDPESFVEDQLLLGPVPFFVASQLDGLNDITDIQYLLFQQTGGRLLSEDQIREVVDYLDAHGFLASPRFESLYREALDAFRARSSRPAFLAGKSYPDDPGELREFIDALYAGNGGPGPVRPNDTAIGKGVRCLIVPHIDFPRGGVAYAHGYARLASGRKPKTVMIFGVSHAAAPVPFILTRKGYETPFGTLHVDTEAVEALAAACTWDPFEHEIAHRSEHSIEFQAVMLAHLYGTGVTIVPILCGSFSDGPEPDTSAFADVNAFLKACQQVMRASDGGMCVVAGVDLAHVGRRFGDAFEIDDEIVHAVKARDDEDLACALNLDADGWYASVMKDGNQRRVCGLNAIYASLKTLDGAAGRGELLTYMYAHDPAGGIVSFAGIAFQEE